VEMFEEINDVSEEPLSSESESSLSPWSLSAALQKKIPGICLSYFPSKRRGKSPEIPRFLILGFLRCRIIPGKVPLPFKYPPNTRQIPDGYPEFFFIGLEDQRRTVQRMIA
jgi:hypothetical protein